MKKKYYICSAVFAVIAVFTMLIISLKASPYMIELWYSSETKGTVTRIKKDRFEAVYTVNGRTYTAEGCMPFYRNDGEPVLIDVYIPCVGDSISVRYFPLNPHWAYAGDNAVGRVGITEILILAALWSASGICFKAGWCAKKEPDSREE